MFLKELITGIFFRGTTASIALLQPTESLTYDVDSGAILALVSARGRLLQNAYNYNYNCNNNYNYNFNNNYNCIVEW